MFELAPGAPPDDESLTFRIADSLSVMTRPGDIHDAAGRGR